MRAFQGLYLVFFIGLYLFLTFAAISNISRIVQLRKIRYHLKCIMVITTTLILIAFALLYIWPFNVRIVQRYDYLLILNAILSIDFVAKIPLAISFFVGYFFIHQKKQIAYYSGLILSVSISLSMFYGNFWGSHELDVNHFEIELKDLPPAFNQYRIIQISDLHLGSFFSSKKVVEKTIKEIEKTDSDIILFTGDLVNNFADETANWKSSFKTLTKNHVCYSILGNHDYGNYTDWKNDQLKSDNFQKIVDAHSLFGMTILNNQNVKIYKGGDSIYISGVENWGHPPFPQYANLDQALSGIPDKAFIILLSHDPAHWNEVIKNRGDIRLTLSGHTHGLQWGISKAGFRFSLSYLTRSQWSGLYRYGDNYLSVNVGLGMVAIPWRINMPPEISVITLKRIEIN